MLNSIRVEQDVRMVARDGVHLSADVYSPALPGKYPTLLMRLPYGSAVASSPVYRHPAWYASQGFCVVVQDVRGTWRSEGSFYPRRELLDTLDAIEWAAQLPQSNGSVGMYGFSYQGVVQLQAAAAGSGPLKAIAPAQTAANAYSGWHYEGGIPLYAGAVNWGLQLAGIAALHDHRESDARRFARLRTETSALLSAGKLIPEEVCDIPWIQDWLTHETNDAYWSDQAIEPATDLPALWIAGWHDQFLHGTITARMAAAGPASAEQSFIVGPWQHQPWSRSAGAVDYGSSARSPVDDEQVRFFRHYLCGSGQARDTSCTIFVTGLNAWRSATQWPTPTQTMSLFLDSDGDANGEGETGTLVDTAPNEASFDVFTSEPFVPVPVLGGRGQGPADQRPIERLRAVATYTSEPLENDIWVVGVISRLTVASSGTDCDWVVRLCDVEPGGRSLNVTQGAVRSRYRKGPDQIEQLIPFSKASVDIPVWSCSHLFKAGHRLRLHVAGTSFPYYGRNPGACVAVAPLSPWDYAAVSQFVLHGPGQESAVTLDVADIEGVTAWPS
jgi:uncharacterized protein